MNNNKNTNKLSHVTYSDEQTGTTAKLDRPIQQHPSKTSQQQDKKKVD